MYMHVYVWNTSVSGSKLFSLILHIDFRKQNKKQDGVGNRSVRLFEEYGLPSSFSVSALLTRWAGQLFVVGERPVHCGLFSIIPGLYLLGATALLPQVWQPKTVIQWVSKCPRGEGRGDTQPPYRGWEQLVYTNMKFSTGRFKEELRSHVFEHHSLPDASVPSCFRMGMHIPTSQSMLGTFKELELIQWKRLCTCPW